MLNLNILDIDHVVFNVADAERSIAFYNGKLGLPAVRVAEYREGNAPFPSVRVNANTIIDLFPPAYHRTQPGGNNVNHIAFTLGNGAAEIEEALKHRGLPIVREMTGNFGAKGDTAHAFHVFDPDGNMLELHVYE
jgi:catechol 2,3-dioxygenase-like lactoylglutathione lyase family enzyme